MLLKTTRALARPGPFCDTSICHASVWWLFTIEGVVPAEVLGASVTG
jgi:hypothetical protein